MLHYAIAIGIAQQANPKPPIAQRAGGIKTSMYRFMSSCIELMLMLMLMVMRRRMLMLMLMRRMFRSVLLA